MVSVLVSTFGYSDLTNPLTAVPSHHGGTGSSSRVRIGGASSTVRTSPRSGAQVLVVRGGIDPPTSGFSDPYRLFHYIPVDASTSQNQGSVTPSDT